MSKTEKVVLSRAEQAFNQVIDRYPMYADQRDWIPVIFDNTEKRNELKEWLDEHGYKRGDKQNRNDWLSPVTGLILFRDSRVAVEAKLRFG